MSETTTRPKERPFLRTKEACEYLAIGKTTLYKWAKIHSVKGIKKGRVRRWPLAELRRLAELLTKVMR